MSFWSQPSLVGRRIILNDQGDGCQLLDP